MHRVGIAYGLRQDHVAEILALPDPGGPFVVAGMYGVDRGRVEAVHGQKDLSQRLVRSGVFLPVTGHVIESPGHVDPLSVKTPDIGLPRQGPEMEEGIVHDVPHHMGPVPQAFAAQLPGRILGGGEEEPRAVVGEDAVDLFRIAQRAQAVAGLHMQDRDIELDRGQSGGERGIRIAVDEERVGLFSEQHLLESDEHASGHLRVGAAGDPQIIIRRGDPHLAEEDLRHVFVVVLAGVDKDLGMLTAQRAGAGRSLDELRPGSHDCDDPHQSTSMLSRRATAFMAFLVSKIMRALLETSS